MIVLDFTKKELYLIERTFDNLLSDNFKAIGQVISTVNQCDNTDIKEIAEKYTMKILPGNADFVDIVMTVCAKCEKIRLGDK